MNNTTIARRLMAKAHLLDGCIGNVFRQRAYRRAAETVLGLDKSVENIVAEGGRKGLERLPGIGRHLAQAIDDLVRTGEFRTLSDEREPRSPK
jgi:DNA polymerase (family X)